MIDELAKIPGVAVAPSRWTGDPALWVDGREIVHEHGDHIEIRLTGKLINALDDDRAMRRSRTSDWVLVDKRERELIGDLARRAVNANRR